MNRDGLVDSRVQTIPQASMMCLHCALSRIEKEGPWVIPSQQVAQLTRKLASRPPQQFFIVEWAHHPTLRADHKLRSLSIYRPNLSYFLKRANGSRKRKYYPDRNEIKYASGKR